jgi:flagellar hook assembly protein FlgD
MQASPNPFSTSTIIGYSVPGSGDVRLEVYDMSGRLVKRLEDSESPEAGEYSIEWDGRDASGSLVPDGVYLYRLTTSDGSLVRSLVLLR